MRVTGHRRWCALGDGGGTQAGEGRGRVVLRLQQVLLLVRFKGGRAQALAAFQRRERPPAGAGAWWRAPPEAGQKQTADRCSAGATAGRPGAGGGRTRGPGPPAAACAVRGFWPGASMRSTAGWARAGWARAPYIKRASTCAPHGTLTPRIGRWCGARRPRCARGAAPKPRGRRLLPTAVCAKAPASAHTRSAHVPRHGGDGARVARWCAGAFI